MKNRDTVSHAQGPLESEKKLRKRERRLNERLLDALAAQEKARERLQRAEARLKKRTARVQRLEGRLAVLHQQLADYTTLPVTSAQSEVASSLTSTSPLDVEIDLAHPTSSLDAASSINVGSDISRPAALNGASMPTQTPPAIIHETFIVTEGGFAELSANEDAEEQEEQPLAAESHPLSDTALDHKEVTTPSTIETPLTNKDDDIAAMHEDATGEEEQKDIAAPEEDEEIEDFILVEDEEDEDEDDDYDDYDDYDEAEAAEEELEFRRRVAPTRVVTRTVQTPPQHIVTDEQEPESALPQSESPVAQEPVLDSIVPQSESPVAQEPVLDSIVPQSEQPVAQEPVLDTVVLQREQPAVAEPVLDTVVLQREQPAAEQPAAEQPTAEQPAPNRPVAILASAEALAYAREARATAQATEDAARLAFARAAEVAERLELLGSGRHLIQELTQLEAEAEQMQSIARENAHAAEIAEQEIDPAEVARLHAETPARDDELDEFEDEEREETSGTEETPPVLIADYETPPPLLIADYEKASLTSPDLYSSKAAEPTPLLFAPGEIEDEEEMVEAVTSMLIADAAAAAAAKAEALAEASSARTREARRLALQADRTLQQLRITVAQGILLGSEAEQALRAAEREATYAHATLADAEAAEERARQNAMNAEAEAEVAEGMAMAADAHARDKEQEHSYFRNPYTVTADIDTPYDPLDDDESDDTLEHPAIRPLRPRESA